MIQGKNYPLVSVILPCYNAEAYLQYALDSLLEQTYPNIEILLINDGSTDKTNEFKYIQSKITINVPREP